MNRYKRSGENQKAFLAKQITAAIMKMSMSAGSLSSKFMRDGLTIHAKGIRRNAFGQALHSTKL